MNSRTFETKMCSAVHLVNMFVLLHSLNLILLSLRLLRRFSVQLIREAEYGDVIGEEIHFVVKLFDTESA